jgi:hypothetical protein
MNLLELISHTSEVRGSKVHSTGKFKVTKLVPVPFTKSLIIQAQFDPLTQPKKKFLWMGGKHTAVIVFYGVDFQDKVDKEHPHKVKVSVFSSKAMRLLSMKLNDVKIRCDCKDFYFTWWYYTNKYNSLSGAPFKKYKRKTDYYPERNPKHVPGMCKHLITLIKYLIQIKILIPE